MNLLQKRGMMAEKLVAIILVVLAGMLIIGTIQRFYAQSDDKEAEIFCRDSIAFRASTQINIFSGSVRPAPLMCKTIDKEISGDREEIKAEFSWLMARCWWMFNEGRYEEIVDTNPWRILGFTTQSNKCFLCYTGVIETDEIDGGKISAREFLRYLSREEHPQILSQIYLNYIQNYGGPGSIILATDLESRSAYGIAFLSKAAGDEGILGNVQGFILETGQSVGLYSPEVNMETSTIVLDKLENIHCVEDMAGQ